jgi:hypothetical protein
MSTERNETVKPVPRIFDRHDVNMFCTNGQKATLLALKPGDSTVLVLPKFGGRFIVVRMNTVCKQPWFELKGSA